MFEFRYSPDHAYLPPGGRQGCLKASACPVRSMKESMEDRWEPREGLARRGCSKGPPGLVNTCTHTIITHQYL